ncbi:hypothetical protein N7488_007293 [Penicillium malachiteum]|nr:hypothetical protein N7488_007293 [Penicillium malachiteum]
MPLHKALHKFDQQNTNTSIGYVSLAQRQVVPQKTMPLAVWGVELARNPVEEAIMLEPHANHDSLFGTNPLIPIRALLLTGAILDTSPFLCFLSLA